MAEAREWRVEEAGEQEVRGRTEKMCGQER